jgi:hypothetical protein
MTLDITNLAKISIKDKRIFEVHKDEERHSVFVGDWTTSVANRAAVGATTLYNTQEHHGVHTCTVPFFGWSLIKIRMEMTQVQEYLTHGSLYMLWLKVCSSMSGSIS